MRAEALKGWAERVWGEEVEVKIHPTLENTHGVYRFGVGLYNLIQRRAPRLHHVYFNYLEVAGMHRRARRIMGAERFRELVKEWGPDRVISVHAHTNHGFMKLAREAGEAAGKRPGCVTYCGELSGGYGFSRHWVNPRLDGFVGATSEGCAAARAVGTPEEAVFEGGFLLRPSFYDGLGRVEEEAARWGRELELERGKFTVLLGTGQAGANNHLVILKKLAAMGRRCQVVVLCARQARVREEVDSWAGTQTGLTVRTVGFTQRMAGLMRLASVVVVRPGTGATSEAILLGVPILHNGIGGVMPQELITVQYCRQHGCSLKGGTVGEIAAGLARLMDRPGEWAAMRERCVAARPKGSPAAICRWIAGREGGARRG